MSPPLRSALSGRCLDPRWGEDPFVEEKRRLLVYLARHARRRTRGLSHQPETTYEIGTRGGRAIRGWDENRGRKDVGVRALLKEISDSLGDAGFIVDRYAPRVPVHGGASPGRTQKPRMTEVSGLDLPACFWAAVDHERERGASDDLVHVDTGRPYDPKRNRPSLIEDAVATSVRRRSKDTPEPTAALIDYLHARPVRLFSDRVVQSLDDLNSTASKTRDDDVRRYEVQVIRQLRVQPLPVYSTRERTQRLVPHGLGLATAPTWIRRAVLGDCVEVDMASAQVALVASLWDAPLLRDFLAASLSSGGPSFWAEIAGWLHGAFPGGVYRPDLHFDRLKGLLKATTYGVCFGMTERNVARWGSPYGLTPTEKRDRSRSLAFLRRSFGAPSGAVGERLLDHPLIAALLDARSRRREQIHEDGCVVDVFGRAYVLGEDLGGRAVTERSALACEAQAAEHFVMLQAAAPFLEEADRVESKPGRYPEAEIALWQSDGFTIRVRQRDRAAGWVSRANAGLALGCQALRERLGCPPVLTEIEVKHGG